MLRKKHSYALYSVTLILHIKCLSCKAHSRFNQESIFAEKHLQEDSAPETKSELEDATQKNKSDESDKEDEEGPQEPDPPSPLKKRTLDTCGWGCGQIACKICNYIKI